MDDLIAVLFLLFIFSSGVAFGYVYHDLIFKFLK